jgi:probable rRNA maturation factor
MYRQINRPTNVLSFPMEESILDETRFIKCKTHSMLGDIIISIPKTKEQAKEYGHSFEREISFLTVHGFLHLIGYDHQTEKEEKIMFKKQEEVLAICGLKR